MLSRQVFEFLKALAGNNNREWLAQHQPEYKLAKKEVEEFALSCAGLAGTMSCMPHPLEAKVFRIFRDIQFSTDKTPYKQNFGVAINLPATAKDAAGYYVNIQPGDCFVAAGIWMPEREVLKKLRTELVYDQETFREIVENILPSAGFKLDMENSLVRLPKGFEESTPADAYVKLKSFTAMAYLTDMELLGDAGVERTAALLSAVRPFIDFLNKAFDA